MTDIRLQPAHLRRAQHAAGRPSGVRRALIAITATAAVATTALTGYAAAGAAGTTTRATASASTDKIYFGVDGRESIAARRTPMGLHIYGQLFGPVPTGRMITVGTSGQSWNAVANAGPGSAIYTNLVRWITTLKSRPGTVFLAFAHEPEAKKAAKLGNAAGYVSAFRHFADLIHQQGASNLKTVWQMTGNAFRVKASDARYASRWYPGDSYVDYVSEDSANWDGCDGLGGYQDLSAMVAAPMAWAGAHHKKLILGEFESKAGSYRAKWLNSAHVWLAAHSAQIEAAYYFDHSSACNFLLTSSADIAALTAIATDRAHFTA